MADIIELLNAVDTQMLLGNAGIVETGNAQDVQNASLSSDRTESAVPVDTQDRNLTLFAEKTEAGAAAEQSDATQNTAPADHTESANAIDTQSTVGFAPTAAQSESAPIVEQNVAVVTVHLTADIAEAGAATDIQDGAVTVNLFSAATDALAAADDQTGAGNGDATASDNLAAIDTQDRMPGLIQTTSDALAAVDVSTGTPQAIRSVVDSLAATDTQTHTFTAVADRIEVGNALDAPSGSVNANVSQAESAPGIADTSSITAANYVGVVEAVNAVDLQNGITARFANTFDVLGLTDAQAASAVYLQAQAEQIVIQDQQWAAFDITRTIAEVGNAVDVQNGQVFVHWTAARAEVGNAAEQSAAINGKYGFTPDTLQARDRQQVVDVSGFKPGNALTWVAEYRRRTWWQFNRR